jgi:hypothetical protein
MKSPWKFLAQFIPQRRSAETPESAIEHHPDSERRRNEAQQSTGLPLDATDAPRGYELDESRPAELKTPTSSQDEHEVGDPPAVSVPDDVEAFHAPARRQTIRSTVRSYALRTEREPNKKFLQTPLTKKLARAKSTDAVAQSAAVVNRHQAARASSSGDAFFDEVASLDEDIKQLRIQLARKLRLQNDHLKKMLERFDVS